MENEKLNAAAIDYAGSEEEKEIIEAFIAGALYAKGLYSAPIETLKANFERYQQFVKELEKRVEAMEEVHSENNN